VDLCGELLLSTTKFRNFKYNPKPTTVIQVGSTSKVIVSKSGNLVFYPGDPPNKKSPQNEFYGDFARVVVPGLFLHDT
jgi:hypothetical protein